ncbi:Biopolymer transport protein ExbD [Candidatus Magnetaquicoccaceae bacterium FCR-1]|uniref:Tol-Pal system protein TolR n=1 Tax=Candidatus Magnetaquiglobus chichijimensis TaxID=3141448 RepID=A0ABQ0CBI6_9PROT
MAMSMNMSGSGSDRVSTMSEINVTPLVDVMLVLLVIFMVTAPLLTQGVEVNLPDSEANAMSTDHEPLVISVTANGATFIEERAVNITEMVDKIRGIRANNPNFPVYVRGDRNAAYGSIMTVMTQLQMAGVDRVGLITEPPG